MSLQTVQRGYNRGAWFFDEQDDHAYLGWLGEALRRERCRFHAYALMTDSVAPRGALDLMIRRNNTPDMASITFDTLKFTKRLQASGLPPEQAEAIAVAFSEATGTELVIKDYLKAEIEEAKNDLIKWMAGLLLAQAGLVTALVKLL
jgi:hypothetical protein